MKTHIFFSLLLLSILPLHAEEIYQITDEQGRKTYTNVAPQQDKGNVEKVNLRNTNIRESQSVQLGNDNNAPQGKEISQRLKLDARQAKQAVDQATEELEQARELRAGDYFNIPGKGLRYTEQYFSRIKQAEQQLDSAKENQRSIQQRKPAANDEFDPSLWQQPNAPQ